MYFSQQANCPWTILNERVGFKKLLCVAENKYSICTLYPSFLEDRTGSLTIFCFSLSLVKRGYDGIDKGNDKNLSSACYRRNISYFVDHEHRKL